MVALTLTSPAASSRDAGASSVGGEVDNRTLRASPTDAVGNEASIASGDPALSQSDPPGDTETDFASQLQETLSAIAVKKPTKSVLAEGNQTSAVSLKELLPTITAALQSQDGETPIDELPPLEDLPPNFIAAVTALARSTTESSQAESGSQFITDEVVPPADVEATPQTIAVPILETSTGKTSTDFEDSIETDSPGRVSALIQPGLSLPIDRQIDADAIDSVPVDAITLRSATDTVNTSPNDLAAALEAIAESIEATSGERSLAPESVTGENVRLDVAVLDVAPIPGQELNPESNAARQVFGELATPEALAVPAVDSTGEQSTLNIDPARPIETTSAHKAAPAELTSVPKLPTPATVLAADTSGADVSHTGASNDVQTPSAAEPKDLVTNPPSQAATDAPGINVVTPIAGEVPSLVKPVVEANSTASESVDEPPLLRPDVVTQSVQQATSSPVVATSAIATPAGAVAITAAQEQPTPQVRRDSRDASPASYPATPSIGEVPEESEPTPVIPPVAFARPEPVSQVSASEVLPSANAVATASPTPTTPVASPTTSPVLDADTSNAQAVKVATQLTTAVEQAIETNARPLRMRLDPPELGSIAVEIRRDGGQVQIEVQFESARALKLASEGVEAFRESLVAKGFDVDADQIRLQLEIGRDVKVTDTSASSNEESPRDQDTQQRDRQERERSEAGQSGTDQRDGDPNPRDRRGHGDNNRPATFTAPRQTVASAERISPRHDVGTGSIDVQV